MRDGPVKGVRVARFGSFNLCPERPMARTNDDGVGLVAEIEALMSEREILLRTIGAASVFFANLSAEELPEAAYDAADVLAKSLDTLPEELLREALELVRPLVEKDLDKASGRSA
jgi:hypothetical protein